MKNFFKALVAGFVVSVALAACGAGNAHAADSMTYKTSTGFVFSIQDVRRIVWRQNTGTVELQYVNGSYNTVVALSDPTGAVVLAIQADHPEFLSPIPYVLYQQSKAELIYCQGGVSYIYWRNNGVEQIADNCALADQSKTAGKVRNP